jgi:two-component system, OmpR family, response regulator VicR
MAELTANKQHVVLVVDDDRPVARMVAATLGLEGYDVLVAHDGKEALERVEAESPDVICLDLQMPVMDGREFFQELRRRGVLTPVVVLSAYGAEAAQLELGADGFVDKPFDPDRLVSAIAETMEFERTG